MMTDVHLARYARRMQARVRWVCRLSRVPGGLRVVRAAQRWPLMAAAYRAFVGFYRPFSSLAEADLAVAPYANAGHENRGSAALHLKLNERAGPSDYAAMFHLRTILTSSFRIFDFGGNVGNLFRCFSSYIELPPGLVWQVHDLASVVAHGRELSAGRGLSQLRFTEEWQDASGADLLLASGSLHYIDMPLSQLLGQLSERHCQVGSPCWAMAGSRPWRMLPTRGGRPKRAKTHGKKREYGQFHRDSGQKQPSPFCL